MRPWVEELGRRRGLNDPWDSIQLASGKDESPFNIVRLLKTCTTAKDLGKGSELHAYIREHKYLQNDTYVCNSLISMYAKCGALSKAQQVLEELPVRNAVTWSALIAGYACERQGKAALKCFDDMLREGHSPDAVTYACVLKACGSIGTVTKGEEIHDKILNLGMLKTNVVLGNSLVDMYAKCGALAKAQQVLKELPIRDVISWNALIAGFVHNGQGNEALKCFDDMLLDGYSPDAVTYACALNACGRIGAVVKAEQIHDKIFTSGMLKTNVVLGNSLVDAYVKCGALVKAQLVLEELPFRDVLSWNALITGYAQLGQGEEALKCLNDMMHEGQSPTAVTFICALKACGSIGSAVKGKEIHEKIASLGMLKKDIVLGSSLVDMYVKCDALEQAQQVVKDLPLRDAFSWSALIAGYARQGRGKEALKCFDDMVCEGYSPTAVTFICVLKACGSIGCAAKGKEIHDKIVSLCMLEKDIMLGNSLVGMYTKCGAIMKAQKVLEELPMRDVSTWNTLIAGYVQQGQAEEALKCFDNMLREDHFPTVVTFIGVLKACGNMGAVFKGKEIHDNIVNSGMLEKDIILANSLVDMYAKCNALAKARQVFEELPVRDVFSWNALIVGYAEQSQGEEALKCFDDMLHEGHSPTALTFICALKACGSIGAVDKGKEIHDTIVNLGILEEDILLGNCLVDMYAKCGALTKAQQVLGELTVHDVFSWSALIAGYVQHGQAKEALNCFDDMLHEGLSPTAATFICVLKACGSICSDAKGKEIHDKIVSFGMLEKDIVLGNSLVDMYAKCGAIAKARQVLNELPIRDVFSWNALIVGYIQRGQGEEALKCFDDMLHEGHTPTAVTFTCVLKACGTIGAAAMGKEIHDKIVVLGMLEKNIELGNSLVDMYMKHGAFSKAQRVLEELPVRDVFSWSALIAGYAQHGQSVETINCFERMLSDGVKPNSLISTFMLNACSHSGLLDQAEIYFSHLNAKYGMHPVLEHYCCMADLFGRAGKFYKTLSVIAEIPYNKCLLSWVALLAACRKWGEVKIGELAFKSAFHLDKSIPAVYVLMADIYAAAGLKEDANEIERMRVANKAWKDFGTLWD